MRRSFILIFFHRFHLPFCYASIFLLLCLPLHFCTFALVCFRPVRDFSRFTYRNLPWHDLFSEKAICILCIVACQFSGFPLAPFKLLAMLSFHEHFRHNKHYTRPPITPRQYTYSVASHSLPVASIFLCNIFSFL